MNTGPDSAVPGETPGAASPVIPADGELTEVYGAAPERTALAWQRTGLSVVLGCFVVFVAALRTQMIAVGITAAVIGLTIAGLSAFAFPVNAYLRGHRVDSWPLLVIAALSVAALGLLGVVASVVSLLR